MKNTFTKNKEEEYKIKEQEEQDGEHWIMTKGEEKQDQKGEDWCQTVDSCELW